MTTATTEFKTITAEERHKHPAAEFHRAPSSDDEVFDRAVRAVEALKRRGRYDLLTLVATHVHDAQQEVSIHVRGTRIKSR